jgi:hypothetical protein
VSAAVAIDGAAPFRPIGHTWRGWQGRRIRTFVFLLAILLVNYTLFRPSPVDIAFATAFALTVFCRQQITPTAFAFFVLIFIWHISMMSASLRFADDEEVVYQMAKISYAISIGLCACLVAVHWTSAQLHRFLAVWILSTTIASTLGILGFSLGIPDFTWDGRAKGLLDDPNMYGAFLLPALFGCIYFVHLGRRRSLYLGCLAWITLGLMLSFSRVAIVAYLLLGAILVFILNRRALLRVVLYAAAGGVVVAVVGVCAALFIEGFDDKLLDRFTFAKDYDLGEQGRLARYAGSIAFILEHPRGMGLLQYEKIFPEPIHNIWISSFMNFGWAAGFAWSMLVVFSITISIRNYRRTGDLICLVLLFGWIGILLCALLHEAERWRPLWLITGILWGVNVRNWPPRAPAPVPPSYSAAVAKTPAPGRPALASA